MIVMVRLAVLILRFHRNRAAGLGNRAAHVLELHGRMEDMETVGEHGVQAAQYHIAGGRGNVLDQHMAA